MTKRLAREEGILQAWAVADLSQLGGKIANKFESVVYIICDRGDRYLSSIYLIR